MSNSHFVITSEKTIKNNNTDIIIQQGVKSLKSILHSAPFFNSTGNLNMNGMTLIGNVQGNADSATTVALTSDNTSGSYFIPFSKTTSTTSNALYIDNTTDPLTYNPSTSTLTATIFSTATAPTSADNLGNKTYIDNFGGTGGWYYTATVTATGNTNVFEFPKCLDNTYNAYEIYFVPNLTEPTTGFFDLKMTFIGEQNTDPVYTTYNNIITKDINTVLYTESPPKLLSLMDFSLPVNRNATIKLDLWGTRNTSVDQRDTMSLSYLNEGRYTVINGIIVWGKNMGTVSYTSGIVTGITLTYSVENNGKTIPVNITGRMTIIVKSKY